MKSFQASTAAAAAIQAAPAMQQLSLQVRIKIPLNVLPVELTQLKQLRSLWVQHRRNISLRSLMSFVKAAASIPAGDLITPAHPTVPQQQVSLVARTHALMVV